MYAHVSSSMGFSSKGSFSFNEFYYFNDRTQCSSAWVGPFLIHGFSANPRILYGLRQSTLLQFSASRRLIWGGNCGNVCRQSAARVRICDCGGESRAFRRLEERREKRAGCVDSERAGCGSSSGGSVDEVLSLLTDIVSRESGGVEGRHGRLVAGSVRKMRIQGEDVCDIEKEVRVDECSQREEKHAGHDSWERSLKGEVVIKSGVGYRQGTRKESSRDNKCEARKISKGSTREEQHIESESRDIISKGGVVIKSPMEGYRHPRRENFSRDDTREARKINRGSRREEQYIESDSRERMSKGGVVIKSPMEGYSHPRRENFSRDDIHEARKDTSSSSYHSVASSGDLESNMEEGLQSIQERVVGESSSVYKNDLRWEEKDVSLGDVKQNTEYESNVRHGESSTKRKTEIQSRMHPDRVKSDVMEDEFEWDSAKALEKYSQVLGSQERNIQRASMSKNRSNMRMEDIKTLSSNLVHGARVQYIEKDQQIVGQIETREESKKHNRTSELHEDNSRRASSSQNTLNSRLLQREENIVSGMNLDKEIRRQRSSTDYQVSRQAESRSGIELEVHNADNNLTFSPEVEDNSNLVPNSLQQASVLHNKKDQQDLVETESRESLELTNVSEIHLTDTKRVSSFQRVSRTRINEQEESSTSVLKQIREAREQQHQMDKQVIRQRGSKKESQKHTARPEFRDNDVERALSSSQIRVNAGVKDRAERSLLVLDSVQEPRVQQTGVSNAESRKPLVMVTPPQTQLVVRGSPAYAAEGDENIDSGFSTSYPSQQGSRSATLQELDGMVQRDEMYGGHSELVIDGGALESANRFDNSSAQFVGEFVDMLQQEVSTSHRQSVASKCTPSIQKESTSSATASVTQDEKDRQQSPKRVSTGSGIKGPSDEMWDVAGTSSSLESSGTKAPKKASSVAGVVEPTVQINTGNVIARRSSRSLWSFISDMVRKGWGSRPESHTPTMKSVTRSSSNDSLNSESWFSGDEHDDNNDGNAKKSKSSILKRPLRTTQTQQASEVMRSQEKLTETGSDVSVSTDLLETGSTSKGASSVSEKGDFEQVEEENEGQGIPSRVVSIDSSFPLVGASTSSSRHSLTKPGGVGISESGKAQMSKSGFTKIDEEPMKKGTTEATGIEEKDVQLKQRKLQRNKQVLRERFDEWEEAITHEHEQRKSDEMFMREALLEAKKAADSWEVPVGAVLVQNGKIIARGYNLVEELRDSTAHAEMICIREASNLLRTWRLSETTLYVTLEPCPMCAGAILQARIDTVVWGAPNKLLGADGSWVSLFPGDEEGRNGSDRPPGPVHPFHPKITIRRGILATECSDVMQQFFQLRRKHKKTESSPHLPISNHPSKFLSKLHHIFNFMFCL
ncbi:CMP/dCMP deaminase [Cinnamomum micranthum f. kanehirae]|uniref:tRNA(adenine(34)) deaminase n=1 Tax=Cinnamomum micranthum f. kanehirae TaxID=337451 RepID=A0A3S3N7R7_9MAGN|nr:CMP/dCMP deaminase [Cinnamomum micranthum f. kanehirae]